MEPVNPQRPHLFLKCRVEDGVPVRLINEEDLHVIPAAQEMWVEAEGAGIGRQHGMSSAMQHIGTRGRITTHRMMWYVAEVKMWLALRLDGVSRIDFATAFMRTSFCKIFLSAGAGAIQSLDIRCNEARDAAELVKQLKEASAAGRWRQGSYDVSAAVGLQRVLGARQAKQQVVGETLDVALTDLGALKQYAAQTVAAARKVAAKQQGNDTSGVQSLLEDFGLLGADGGLVVKGGTTAQAVAGDVLSVCEAALKKRGGFGMLLVHDIFCLVNRARGTALVSPEEVMEALRALGRSNKLRLRNLGNTGTWAACLPSTNDAEVDARLLKLAEAGPLSAFQLGKELGVTTAEAQYLLRDAEARAVLVRDEATAGVFFYRNFFNDF